MEGDSSLSGPTIGSSLFQSTPSAWRVTGKAIRSLRGIAISIHTLRMEGDAHVKIPLRVLGKISIHTLRMEGDQDFRLIALLMVLISIHTLRMEGDSKFA